MIPPAASSGNSGSKPGGKARAAGSNWGLFLILPAILAVLFHRSFSDPMVIFSNDAPLGLTSSISCKMPGILSGFWQSLNWIGKGEGSALPSLSYGLLYLLGPVGYAKFGVPLALAFLGFATMILFRTLGFTPLVQVAGGVACALNMSAFSSSAWGLLAWALLRGTSLLAVAAIAAKNPRHPSINLVLAGFAVGMGVMDGADLGAFFSLYIAAFGIFHAFSETSGGADAAAPLKRIAKGCARVAVIATAAAILAAHALQTLIGSQIQGIQGTGQDTQTKAEQWSGATRWSLPKLELLRVVLPGVFGYGTPAMYGKSDEDYGGAHYWGRVGQAEGNDKDRLSGSGEYAGIFVVLVAVWGLVQAIRKNERAIRCEERRYVLFWAAAALISVLLAFGRHAPFYQFLYALPYFSTVRNPIKFMHPFQMSLIILFGYGLQGIWRLYMAPEAGKPPSESPVESLKSWWKGLAGFDKEWARSMLAVMGASVFGFFIYAASGKELRAHLKACFPDAYPEALIRSIASFSVHDVRITVLILAVSLLLMALIFSGYFRGGRIPLASGLIVVLLAIDLGRANLPWLVYFNYRERYSTNPVLDLFRKAPHEGRVHGMLPFLPPDQQTAYILQSFQQFYFLEWLQHRFQFYNVQSLDVSQEPRMASDKMQYLTAFRPSNLSLQARYWELTNTRYLLGVTGAFLEVLNNQLDPEKRRFKIHTPFNLVQAPGDARATAEPNQSGPFAVIEFSGALPRAKLYSQWEVIPDPEAQLRRLADPSFDPHQTVVVAEAPRGGGSGTAASAAANAKNEITFSEYLPKQVRMKAEANAPSILLLNDRFDPHWKVFVDGEPAKVLKCNFMVRGVEVPAGEHIIEYRFEPPAGTLYLSLAAIACGLMLCGVVALGRPLKSKGAVKAG